MLLVADLKLQVADLIHEVAGLRMEVPELRPGEIRLNLTTASFSSCPEISNQIPVQPTALSQPTPSIYDPSST